ncbi:MAG: peptidoglycan-binding domain-containing protein [Polyangiales bacterium]
MIPFSSTIRRRGLRSFAFHPAGAVSLAPGSYDLTLEVTFDATLAPLASSAEFARLLRGIVRDAALFPGGGVTVVGDPVASSAGATARASARLAFSRAINDDDAARAMARALYWSTTLSRTQDRATLGAEVPRNDVDGGSSITSALRGAPRFPVTRATFRQAAVGATPTATPAPPAPAFVGKPEAQLSRGEITRYQQMLVALGHDVGRSGADGLLGTGTRTAVQAFQRAQGISAAGQAGYGTLGPQTQAALERARPGTPMAPATPTPTRPPPTPPSPTPTPNPPTTPTPPRPQQASMSTGTVVAVSLVAAAVGAGIAFRDKLFPARPSRGPRLRRGAR